MEDFNLIYLEFISSNLWASIRINCFWNFFWIARLNFSMFSRLIFITTTSLDEAIALVFLGWLLTRETSPNMDPAFRSAMITFSFSWREMWPSWTLGAINLAIRTAPVRTTNKEEPVSPSVMMVCPSLNFWKIPMVFTSLDFSSSENSSKNFNFSTNSKIGLFSNLHPFFR